MQGEDLITFGEAEYNIYLCPFKTPLDDRYDNLIPEEARLSVSNVYKHYMEKEAIKLSTIYDFSNTNRYYDHRAWGNILCLEFPMQGLEHIGG